MLDGGTALVGVIANGAGLSASIAGVVKSAVKSATSALLSSGNELGGGIGAVFSTAATVGAAALAALTVKGISDFQGLATEVRTLEKQLGLTAEAASVFHAQATALGLSTDKLTIGFGIFAKNLANGAPALEKYGITAIRAADGQVDFTKTLDEVRTKFQDLAPGIDRTAFAMNVFGRSGKALIPFLSATNEEMAKFADNARAAGLIMSEEDVQAARDLGIAQRELGGAFKGLEVSLARAVIPLLISLADAFATLIRFVSPLLPELRDLGVIWLGYKAFTFIPGLLLAIGSALEFIGVTGASEGLASAAVGMTALGAAALPVTAVLVAAAGAILSITGVIDNFGDAITKVLDAGLSPFAGAAAIASASGLSMARSFDIFNKAVAHSPDGVVNLSDVIDKLRFHMDAAGHSVRNFAGLTNKHLKEFKVSVVDSVQVSIGAFANLDAAFTLTANQLKNQANAAVKIARQEHQDLKAIFSDRSLSDAQKQALAQLPADQRHAFAEGGKAVRQQIAQDAIQLKRLNDQTFNQITTSARNKLKTGGTSAGKGLTDGLVAGINSGSGAVVSAANSLGNNVIAALRASMGIKSPSTEGRKIGEQLMEGLIQGMNSRFRKVEDTLKQLIPLMQKALGVGAADQARAFLRDLEALDKRFTKLKDKIGNFRTAIRGAFGDFGDLLGGVAASLEQFRQDQAQFLTDQAAFAASDQTGTAPTAPLPPDLHALVAGQVAQAAQMAKLLKQLQQAGLSTPLLQQISSQGAGGIATAQELLADPALIQQLNDAQQQIANITQATVDKMTAAAFGDKVVRMGNELENLLSSLNEFQQGLRIPELKDETRDFINQLRRLNDALASFGLGPTGTQNGREIRDQLLALKRRNVTTGL